MAQIESENLLERLLELLQVGNSAPIESFLSELHPADVADLLESLTPTDRARAWLQIPDEQGGFVLNELQEAVRGQLIGETPKERLAQLIQPLDVDDIADLVPDVPANILSDVLFTVNQEARKGLGEVLSYPEDSAGGLMDLDMIAVRDDVTLGVITRFLRLRGELPLNTDVLFLVDREGVLKGVLPIGSLLIAPLNDLVAEHVDPEPVFFGVLDSEEEVASAFEKYNLISAPVVDEKNRLIGRITIDDVVDVIREIESQMIMAGAGLRQDEDVFSPVTQTARSRAVWLGVNLMTALLGSWVIGQFEGTIQKLVALAVLMPIVASMGGNAGMQTLTIVIRGLSVGNINSSNIRAVLRKEILVGILNGLLWAVAVALIAALWFGDPNLGVVIALATLINLVIAAFAGVFLPIILDKLGIDPALAGGVALTTVTDVVGYFAVLGLAATLLF
ncbi:MAG TPA: magnesium transporter [Gammaproteobacteria bacterium]|nr:magnesium transporter [Gammaproteobacteria bacterium]